MIILLILLALLPIKRAPPLVRNRHFFYRLTSSSEKEVKRKPRKYYVPCVSIASWPTLRRATRQGDHAGQLLNETPGSNKTPFSIPIQRLQNLCLGVCV
jgi:hypothetical protein